MKTFMRMGLAAAVLAFGACGDDDDNGGDDTVNLPDADITPDAQTCLAESTINVTPAGGAMGNSAVFRVPKTGGGTQLLWNLVVSPDGAPLDLVQFSIDEPVTLNTPLDLVKACTDQSNYCWVMLADATITGGQPNSNFFMYPDSGTITITEAGPTDTGKFTATISESIWNHYVGSPPSPANDGCTTTFGAMTVDLPIQAPPSGKPSGLVGAHGVTNATSLRR